ncbi:hypothetical protein TNCV_3774851 [Trichonephila clavipes]|nr:hypothetical protein TNCV_3774851 [Trichonephila clavipes]
MFAVLKNVKNHSGCRVASDVLPGENFKEALKTRSRESGKQLAQKAIDKFQSMVGKGQYKRKRKVHVNPSVILGHAKALEKQAQNIPLIELYAKCIRILKERERSMSFIQDYIFSGQMPKKDS